MGEILRDQSNHTVTGASSQLLGPNPRRIGLLISTPKVADVWISFQGPAGVGVGLPIRVGTAWVKIDETWMGAVLQESIQAISAGAPEVIGVVEVFQ